MQELTGEIKNIGFDNVSQILIEKIPFEPSLIELCKMNSCGNYGKSYTCPPYIGETEELIRKVKSFKYAIVFQKIYKLEDSFDIEGMNDGNKNFREITEKASKLCKLIYNDFLILSAGGCRICEKCGVTDNIPCRFPNRAFASLESYAIHVSSLAQACGMNYINGQNTVTYFGAVFF